MGDTFPLEPMSIPGAAAADLASAPEWVPLAPAGATLAGACGQRVRSTRPKRTIAMTSLPLAIDREHESMLPWGEAKVAGWIEEIEHLDEADGDRGPGFWGRVRWTPSGRGDLSLGRFRAIAAVVRVIESDDGSDPVLSAFESAALTAASGSAPKAAPTPSLPLPEAALAAVTEATAAAAAARRELEQVKRSHFAKLADAAVGAAVRAGKIPPALAKYHRRKIHTEADLEDFLAYAEHSPVLVDDDPDGRDGPGGAPDAPMADEDRKLARILGLTDEDWRTASAAGDTVEE